MITFDTIALQLVGPLADLVAALQEERELDEPVNTLCSLSENMAADHPLVQEANKIMRLYCEGEGPECRQAIRDTYRIALQMGAPE